MCDVIYGFGQMFHTTCRECLIWWPQWRNVHVICVSKATSYMITSHRHMRYVICDHVCMLYMTLSWCHIIHVSHMTLLQCHIQYMTFHMTLFLCTSYMTFHMTSKRSYMTCFYVIWFFKNRSLEMMCSGWEHRTVANNDFKSLLATIIYLHYIWFFTYDF